MVANVRIMLISYSDMKCCSYQNCFRRTVNTYGDKCIWNSQSKIYLTCKMCLYVNCFIFLPELVGDILLIKSHTLSVCVFHIWFCLNAAAFELILYLHIWSIRNLFLSVIFGNLAQLKVAMLIKRKCWVSQSTSLVMPYVLQLAFLKHIMHRL